MSLSIQLWNSSVEKQRKFGSKAEFLGQAKFDSMMLTELMDGRDAWMGVAIPPQVADGPPVLGKIYGHRTTTELWSTKGDVAKTIIFLQC